MPEIVLATANPHKIAELRAILTGGGVRLLGLDEAGGPFPEPREAGATFLENATIKALAYADATRRPCLADDSGLEVDALGGRPGVISSHYATDGRETGLDRARRDADNTARVLDELRQVTPTRRSARFVCVMVLAAPGAGGDPGRVIASARGLMEGRIGVPPRVPAGSGGFGYDPIFLVAPGFERTAAELDPREKNALSHRAAAARAIAPALDR